MPRVCADARVNMLPVPSLHSLFMMYTARLTLSEEWGVGENVLDYVAFLSAESKPLSFIDRFHQVFSYKHIELCPVPATVKLST